MIVLTIKVFIFYSRHSEINKNRVVRHIYLVRHGQYNTRTKVDDQKVLTELGM